MRQDDTPGFEILAPPRWDVPLVFNSPHSGTLLPESLLQASRLSPDQLRSSEDCLVDHLFMGCLDAGAPLLRALYSRSYVDLNREPHEFDPRLFSDALPGYMNTASPRVASGLGTIPRTVGDGISIYRSTLTLAEALTRIETLYRPYHRALSALLDEAVHATGQVLLVDCHSMPASAVRHLRGHRSAEPDVVIGDRFGSACSPHLIGLIEEHFAASGLVVSRNKPYAGGFITETHGRPRENRHAVQIEVNRALYMDERSRKPHAGFDTLKSLLDGLAVKLAETLSLAMGQPMAPTLPAKAAE